jgi:hypothetical protein
MRALTLTAAAALGFSLALAPSYARAADKDWGACVNKDGNESYLAARPSSSGATRKASATGPIAYFYPGRLV